MYLSFALTLLLLRLRKGIVFHSQPQLDCPSSVRGLCTQSVIYRHCCAHLLQTSVGLSDRETIVSRVDNSSTGLGSLRSTPPSTPTAGGAPPPSHGFPGSEESTVAKARIGRPNLDAIELTDDFFGVTTVSYVAWLPNKGNSVSGDGSLFRGISYPRTAMVFSERWA